MVVAAIPDLIAALVLQARTFANVAALCKTGEPTRPVPRIAERVRLAAGDTQPWPMPTYGITFRKSGGPGSDPDVRLNTTRVLVTCYGPTTRESDLLFRTLHPYLQPEQGVAPGGSFVQAHTAVYFVIQQGAEITTVEPDTNWPRTQAFYLATYSEAPR